MNISFRKLSKFAVCGLFVSLCITGIYGCSAIKQIGDSIASLKRIQFKLNNVSNFTLNGVSLSGKSSISDFSVADGLKLASSFSSKTLPFNFTLNVAAKNPNTGTTSGTKSTLATLTGLDWKLYLDDVETISGDINNSVAIPATGEQTIIPLTMSVDVMKFMQNKSYESLVNLALALGGNSGSAARVKLDAKPTIKTVLGNISYPSRLTIVNTQFTN